MLDKKQIPVIFLLEFKMGCKAVETTHNISSTFGPGTANEQTYSAVVVQEVLQRRWQPWRWDAKWSSTGNWQQPIERIIEADLTTAWEVAKELSVDLSTVIPHLKQTGNVKKLDKWLQAKKVVISKCHLLLFCVATMIGLWHAMKSGFYTTTRQQPAQSSDQEEAPNPFPKLNLHPKKNQGYCVVVSCPCDSLQLSESQWSNYIWEVCSANEWDAPKTAKLAANFGQQKGPRSSPWPCPTTWQQPVLQKLNKSGYEVLPHPPYSPDFSSADYHFFNHLNNFLQGTCFQNQQNAFQEFTESQSTDFYVVGINLFLIGKN